MSVTIRADGRFSEDDLNLSNGNFVKLMDLLDTPIDTECLCGNLSGIALRDLRKNVSLMLDGVREMPELDGGTQTIYSGKPGGCTMIECGWRPGYLESRLSALLAVIEEAIEEGVALVYA